MPSRRSRAARSLESSSWLMAVALAGSNATRLTPTPTRDGSSRPGWHPAATASRCARPRTTAASRSRPSSPKSRPRLRRRRILRAPGNGQSMRLALRSPDQRGTRPRRSRLPASTASRSRSAGGARPVPRQVRLPGKNTTTPVMASSSYPTTPPPRRLLHVQGEVIFHPLSDKLAEGGWWWAMRPVPPRTTAGQ